MKTTFMKNWKTNTIAVLSLVIIGLYVINYITTEQLTGIQAFLLAVGLAVSKDSDKS